MLLVEYGEILMLLLLASICTDPDNKNPEPSLIRSGAIAKLTRSCSMCHLTGWHALATKNVKSYFRVWFGNVTNIYLTDLFASVLLMFLSLFSTFWVTWGCHTWLWRTWFLCTSFLCSDISGRGVPWKIIAEGKERKQEMISFPV